jgi:tripartite-type tricarboxylate transporter receptor subunit TctC
MNPLRRNAAWLFSTTFGLLALLIAGSPAAQTIYPSKPIRLVGGFAPGTQLDTLARTIGQKMSESWGQPVVVDNRTGGGGMLAAGILANADGHTLFFGRGFAITVALQPNFSYNPLKDFAGVAQIGFGTQALIVAPSLGVRSVKDLIALGQTQPGKIIYSFGGTGSESHLNVDERQCGQQAREAIVGAPGEGLKKCFHSALECYVHHLDADGATESFPRIGSCWRWR